LCIGLHCGKASHSVLYPRLRLDLSQVLGLHALKYLNPEDTIEFGIDSHNPCHLLSLAFVVGTFYLMGTRKLRLRKKEQNKTKQIRVRTASIKAKATAAQAYFILFRSLSVEALCGARTGSGWSLPIIALCARDLIHKLRKRARFLCQNRRI
jgi:hypothetical protein